MRHAAVSGLLLAALTAPAMAQATAVQAGRVVPSRTGLGWASDSRQGWWFGGGLGTGAGSMHCGICEAEREQGTTGYLRAGRTINRKLLLGVEGSAWQRSGDAGRRRLLALTAGAWWYPNPRHGWFLRWGAGVSRWKASDGDEAVVSQALALVAGAGYEVRVNPVLSIVPYLNALGSSSGSLWLETRDDVSFERRKLPTGGHALLFQVGVGITRH